MILKRRFDPRKVVSYVWKDLALSLLASGGAVVAFGMGLKEIALPFPPLGVLGTALAIFLAFRNNTSYNRWAEASQIWFNLQATSRVFARLVITFVNSHRHTPSHNPETAAQLRQEMIYRHLAWVNAIRLQLREQHDWEGLKAYLSEADFQSMMGRANKPNHLLLLQGSCIYDAMASGTLQGFDSFQLENTLLQLTNYQAACERIKTIPIPRQYDYFTRLFVHVFVVLMPLFLLSVFAQVVWAVVPVSLVIAFIYAMVERVGAVNEDPFENRITDVPLSAICLQIERDLRELLGETELPPAPKPMEGYLF
jgi:putative membrane protein